MRSRQILAVCAASAIFSVAIAGQAIASAPAAKDQEDQIDGHLDVRRFAAPVVPRPKDDLQLGGPSPTRPDREIGGANVELRLSQERMGNRAQLAKVADGARRPTPVGFRMVPSKSRPRWHRELAPHGTSSSDVGPGLGNSGVYPGVDATSRRLTKSPHQCRPSCHGLNPDSVKPTKVVWLWPLSDWPDRNANNVFLTDRTPTEITPTGRLNRVLDLESLRRRRPNGSLILRCCKQ